MSRLKNPLPNHHSLYRAYCKYIMHMLIPAIYCIIILVMHTVSSPRGMPLYAIMSLDQSTSPAIIIIKKTQASYIMALYWF